MNGKYVISEYEGMICGMLLGENGKAVGLDVVDPKRESLVGNIYVGNVNRIAENLNAVFVDIPGAGTTFMQLKDAEGAVFVNKMRQEGPLRAGDLIIVQLTRDAKGKKLPSVSSCFCITGKYLVLTLNGGVRFSKKLGTAKKNEIQQLLSVDGINGNGFGFVVRTIAGEAESEEILNEAKKLISKGNLLITEAIQKGKSVLLHKEEKVYIKSSKEAGSTVTDNLRVYNELVAAGVDAELYENRNISLNALYGIKTQIEEARSKRVWLKSGGFLVIEPTEALTVIDVNTGKSEYGKNSEKEYFRTDLEAAKEASRQIRLRNLSGIIIIDFINLENEENRADLLTFMRKCLKEDPIKSEAIDITRLGLMEITRKKERVSLYEVFNIC